MYNFYLKKLVQPPGCGRYVLLTILLLVLLPWTASAGTTVQKLTLSEKNAPLSTVFQKISNQTDYDFLFSTTDLREARPVTIVANNEDLEPVLRRIFTSQPLQFAIQEKMIVVFKKPGVSALLPPSAWTIRGTVSDASGAPLPGATIRLKGAATAASTGPDGNFMIHAEGKEAVLIISFVGYQPLELLVTPDTRQPLAIRLTLEQNPLNQVQVIGYGATTKRFNTGSVSTVTEKELAAQPVTNVLSALSGRAPGVFVQTTNGLPGGIVQIQIRGKGSILAGTDPLYIVDGVPFPAVVVSPLSAIAAQTIGGASSPLNSLNPSDIESINILKDADATSIYGSRGANGVVLITTKKGKAEKTAINVNYSQGISKAASFPKLLNRQQFLELRREAFKNAAVTPTTFNARDLLVWDTTASTNWPRYYFGGTGQVTNFETSLSGGQANTNFTISGNYHRETTILPGENHYSRGGLSAALNHRSADRKFSIALSASYMADNNTLANVVNNIGLAILMPPNYPLYNPDGTLNWYIANPIGEAKASSVSKTNNLLSNLSLQYTIADGLNVKVSSGFNKVTVDQDQLFPAASLYPGAVNYSNFGYNASQSFITEPQITYDKVLGRGRLNALLGGTYQYSQTENQLLTASGFTNEGLMQDIGSAGSVLASGQSAQYKYVSLFGRLTYNLADKYVVNATLRRDGSSRFGPGNQFGTFGSIGTAWIFSNEDWFSRSLPVVSFGKLRASYGLTGNDQISDYQYLSTYESTGLYNYQGIPALLPARIANADFHWESTRKLEFAIELGFLNNRLLATANHYVNRSRDQLVAYSIPYVTGFNTYQANLPAVVKNSGWEFSVNAHNIKSNRFNWHTTFNITFSKNVLESFQDFAQSSYAQTLQLGYDITRVYSYLLTGVNPETGQANYAPEPGSASGTPYFYRTIGKRTPDYYFGIGNSFSYKNWALDIFGQFVKQMTRGGLTYPPGIRFNSYTIYLDRWTTPGDATNVPRASTINDPYFANSSANFFDASYFRLKNISLSYHLPATVLTKLKATQVRIYLQGQNVLTFWDKNSALMDPESGALTTSSKNIPPLTTYLAGIQFTF